MNVLDNKYLQEINGGAIGKAALFGLGIGIFIVGVIDGIIRPLKCNR